MTSVVIPCRNEEQDLPWCLDSVIRQPWATEVLVVDDGSTDRSAEIAREFAPAVRVLPGAERPAGWAGPAWSVYQGVQHAMGPLVLRIDCDTRLLDVDLAGLLKAHEQFALLSLAPEMESDTWLCQEVQETVRDLVLSFPWPLAWGKFMLLRKDVYAWALSLPWVHGVQCDDVRTAQVLSMNGCKTRMMCGKGMVKSRQYRTFGDAWQGWARSLYPAFGLSWRDTLKVLAKSVPALVRRHFRLGTLLVLTLLLWSMARGTKLA